MPTVLTGFGIGAYRFMSTVDIYVAQSPNEICRVRQALEQPPLLNSEAARGRCMPWGGGIVDSLNVTGYFLGAWSGGRIVAAARMNFVRDGGVREYLRRYGLTMVSDYMLNEIAVTSRFVVASNDGQEDLIIQLNKFKLAFLLRKGIKVEFLHCNQRFFDTFYKLGFGLLSQTGHPGTTNCGVVTLDLMDLPRFNTIQSPLGAVLKEYFKESLVPVTTTPGEGDTF